MTLLKNRYGKGTIMGLLSIVAFAACELVPIDPIGPRFPVPGDTDTDEPQTTDMTTDTTQSTETTGSLCDDDVPSGVCGALPIGATIFLSEENNYTFQSSLQVSHEVVRGSTVLDIDWSSLTNDFLGNPVNPVEDVDTVTITVWNLSQAELLAQMSNDDLDLSKTIGAIAMYPDGTTTQTDLLSFGSPDGSQVLWEHMVTNFDSDGEGYDPTQITHMLVAQSGTTLGRDVLMMKTFSVDNTAATTELSLENDDTVLSYAADLRSLTRVGIPTGTNQLTINWEYIVTNMKGQPFPVTNIGRVTIAHFADMNVCEMENDFIHLEEMADELFTYESSETMTNIALRTLESADGTRFSGIDSDGTWVFALQSVASHTAAPQLLTVLTPCD